MALAPLSAGFRSLPPLPTIKLGPSSADSQVGGWTCAHSRPLWVSPTTSPVRLGVSPAAAPTPTGVFNQRFEALFPHTGALGCMVCFTSAPFLPVYLCVNVGPQGSASQHPVGSASCSLACPIPQSSTLLDLPAAALLQVLCTQAAALAAGLLPSYWSG